MPDEDILPPWMREKIEEEKIQEENDRREQPVVEIGVPVSYEVPDYGTGKGGHKVEIDYGKDKGGREIDITKLPKLD